jgi:hypothetical protein
MTLMEVLRYREEHCPELPLAVIEPLLTALLAAEIQSASSERPLAPVAGGRGGGANVDGDLTLREVADRFARRLGREAVKPPAVRKWIRTGLRGSAGIPVRLKAYTVGGEYRVEPDALEQFIEDLRQPAKQSQETSQSLPAPEPAGSSRATPELKSAGGKSPAEVIALYKAKLASGA